MCTFFHVILTDYAGNLKVLIKNRTGKLVDNAVIINPRMPMTLTMTCTGRRPQRSMIPGAMKLPANDAMETRDAKMEITII